MTNAPADPLFAARAERASLQLAGLLLAALTCTLVLRKPLVLALVGPLALGLLVAQLRAFGKARSRIPNLITALRAVLTGSLGFPSLQQPAVQTGVVFAVFALDGLDGLVARRLQAVSPLGAHFDMESDGFLVLMVCTQLTLGGLGAWVLLAGLLRYAYTLSTVAFAARGEAPRSRFGRYAFAASLSAFALALWPGAHAWPAALFGTLLLCASFSRSFYWSFRKG
jgi:phosphatidylglycerophosphate synthase